MKGETVQTKIANVTLRLPVFRDEKTTLELAEEVGRVVLAMEADAERFDTQAFALRAAFEFARRLKALELENAADLHELVKALDGMATGLHQLVEEFDEDQ